MADTTAVSSSQSSSSSSTTTSTTSSSSTLDKEAFLKLLVTQMQNQDPMNPMDDTQYVTQLAQFTSLEQTQTANRRAESTQAYSMIGKIISYQDSSTGDVTTGQVNSVVFNNDTAMLSVNNDTVSLDDVTQVYSDPSSSNVAGVEQALTMIGHDIEYTDSKENTVRGTVSSVSFTTSGTILNVDDTKVSIGSVTKVY